MTDSRPSSGAGGSVCPFVALAEDRDRRADTPDEGNRCYAERAPRRRDLVYQSEYCYTAEFARCSVFLAWAARSAAQPAAAISGAHGSGAGLPTDGPGNGMAGDQGAPAAEGLGEESPAPTPEGGLFGPADGDAPEARARSEQLDWVSASAWAEAPWDERAELEADEMEAFEAEEEEYPPEEEGVAAPEEATRAPKVPAALPMRRRRRPQEPIRSPGSGEWYYADPPGHEPLVSRRSGITPTVMLAVLGVLVVSVVVFLLAAQLGGGGDGSPAAAASPSLAASLEPSSTRAPSTAAPSTEPSPTPTPKSQFYRVKSGDSLSGIAAKFEVELIQLQCINGILDKNLIVLGERLQIPPEGYECARGWRNATPEP